MPRAESGDAAWDGAAGLHGGRWGVWGWGGCRVAWWEMGRVGMGGCREAGPGWGREGVKTVKPVIVMSVIS